MSGSTRSNTTRICLALLGAATVTKAHSWIEQLTVIAPNGTFVGQPGFPRGNVLRSDPAFSDVPMVHLITDAPGDPMCKDTQQSSEKSESSPRLNAAPGDAVALRFQENGHVTLPENQPGKAENRGDVFVYATTEPKENELFNDVHGVWTEDGKGGDGRGTLLVKANYDDGQCYQVNGGAISTQRQQEFSHQPTEQMGADLWCQTDVRLPSETPSGKPLTLYWVWEWPTAAGQDPGLPDGKNETYTSCMDIDMVAASEFSQKAASSGFVQGQPIEQAAVPEQFAKLNNQPATSNSSAPAGPDSPPAPPAPASPASPAASAESSSSAGDGTSPVAPAEPLAPVNTPAPAAPATPAEPLTPVNTPAPAAPATPAESLTPANAPAPPSAASTIISPVPGAAEPAAPAGVASAETFSTIVTPSQTETVAPSATPANGTVTLTPKIRGRSPVVHLYN